MVNPITERNSRLGSQVVEALKRRNFDAYYCQSCEDAVKAALSLIEEGSSVSWGGSASISQVGLIDALYRGNYEILDRAKADPKEMKAFYRMAMQCNTFLASANAITEDGQIVNVDGTGNRVSSMIFGPDNVIVVVGINKVVKTLDDAISRARGTAAPINAQRFDIKTPCKETGRCMDCKSDDCICATTVIHRMCKPARRIKVILVGESLGF